MMDATLQKQLTMQIEQQLEAKVLDVQQFTIPYAIIDITYTPMIKKRMDILMKMLLTSYQSGQFTNSEQLASILQVEALFINDLTRQMEHSKLIIVDETMTLTAKGEEQLKQGVYEEQLPVAQIELMYSSLHDQLFAINIDDLELLDDLPEPLANVEERLPEEAPMLEAITKHLKLQHNDQHVQSIEQAEQVELYDFPIALFICFDQKNDRYFSRAYNLYVHEWDDTIASTMDRQHVTQWRQ